jgi:hypothetical protein
MSGRRQKQLLLVHGQVYPLIDPLTTTRHHRLVISARSKRQRRVRNGYRLEGCAAATDASAGTKRARQGRQDGRIPRGAAASHLEKEAAVLRGTAFLLRGRSCTCLLPCSHQPRGTPQLSKHQLSREGHIASMREVRRRCQVNRKWQVYAIKGIHFSFFFFLGGGAKRFTSEQQTQAKSQQRPSKIEFHGSFYKKPVNPTHSTAPHAAAKQQLQSTAKKHLT